MGLGYGREKLSGAPARQRAAELLDSAGLFGRSDRLASTLTVMDRKRLAFFGHSHHARVWRKHSSEGPAELLAGDTVAIEEGWRYFLILGKFRGVGLFPHSRWFCRPSLEALQHFGIEAVHCT